MRSATICLLSLVLAVAATAQVSVGNYPLEPLTFTVSPVPITIVDLSSGATGTGTINTVAVRVFARECTGGFKVKFFTRGGDSLTQFAERGPFNVTAPLMKVALTPPVDVPANALIGVTQLQACAPMTGQSSITGKSAVRFSGDVTSGQINAGTTLENYALAAYGASSPDAQVRTQIVIAAGAAQGSGGALFKTDLFLGNTREANAKGTFVYHPAGTSGTSSDPSFPFDVAPITAVTLGNFVGQSLGRTGLGSIDVYTTIGYDPPTLTARIYDDAGAAGTKGFTFDAFQPHEALQPFENAMLFGPPDARFRMNLGIRTLDQGGEIQISHYDSAGRARVFGIRKTYPANYFIQDSVANITGFAPQPGDFILLYSQQIPYFAYAALTDNANNDPSVQVAKHLK
jgi:hypothetical protein